MGCFPRHLQLMRMVQAGTPPIVPPIWGFSYHSAVLIFGTSFSRDYVGVNSELIGSSCESSFTPQWHTFVLISTLALNLKHTQHFFVGCPHYPPFPEDETTTGLGHPNPSLSIAYLRESVKLTRKAGPDSRADGQVMLQHSACLCLSSLAPCLVI